jgi:hypothetical protein
LRQLLAAVSLLCAHSAAVEGAVREATPRVDARIESNRRRSERQRSSTVVANNHTNGHRSDVRLVLTNHGVITECARCGREVTT